MISRRQWEALQGLVYAVIKTGRYITLRTDGVYLWLEGESGISITVGMVGEAGYRMVKNRLRCFLGKSFPEREQEITPSDIEQLDRIERDIDDVLAFLRRIHQMNRVIGQEMEACSEAIESLEEAYQRTLALQAKEGRDEVDTPSSPDTGTQCFGSGGTPPDNVPRTGSGDTSQHPRKPGGTDPEAGTINR